jgi:hypothetical protein
MPASARNVRVTLHSAFSFVKGVEQNQASASLTLDHLLSQQISSLKGGETRELLDGRGGSLGKRISRWDRIDQLQSDLEEVIKAIVAAGDDPAKLRALGIYEVALGEPATDEASV